MLTSTTCVYVHALEKLMFNSIWLIFLTNGFRQSILISLTPYVTSDFQSHSLLTVIGIVSSSMTAATYIPMAKILDVWGRAEGFLLMIAFSTLGLILMAVSKNLATFCAAQVPPNIPRSCYLVLTSVRSSTLSVLQAPFTPLKWLQSMRRI